jgi:urea transport system substrate-binding protein
MKTIKNTNSTIILIVLSLSFAFLVACQNAQKTIKVGVLHSLTGTMAISEIEVKNATILAIDEINEKGGLLGMKIEPIIVDAKSDNQTFAKLADSLINKAKVEVVFGCWTSASRKTVKPIFEKYDHLLFYPIQYE